MPLTKIIFVAEIVLSDNDLDEEATGGSLEQAVQNVIGKTGAAVIAVREDWEVD